MFRNISKLLRFRKKVDFRTLTDLMPSYPESIKQKKKKKDFPLWKKNPHEEVAFMLFR